MRRDLPVILAVFGLAILAGCATGPNPGDLFPRELTDWRARGLGKEYAPEELSGYLGETADLFLALNVERVYSVRYEKPDSPPIVADVFKMATSADAFGAYHLEVRDGEPASLGQESEVQGAWLTFWQGRYFVSVASPVVERETKIAVVAIGQRISDAIPRDPIVPELYMLMPKEGAVPGHVHYFHDARLLSRFQTMAGENLLELGMDTDGILGRYVSQENAPPFAAIIVRYPTLERAQAAFGGFSEAYLQGASGQGVAKDATDTWNGARLAGAHLMLVMDAPSEERALGLLDSFSARF